MSAKDEQFLERLLAAFRVEAEEHIQAIAAGLLELEKAPEGHDKAQIVEAMYREAHSLKGAARSVNMDRVETICQSMESVFGELKAGRLHPSVQTFDTLHRATDAMSAELSQSGSADVEGLVRELDGHLKTDQVGIASGKLVVKSQPRAASSRRKKTSQAKSDDEAKQGAHDHDNTLMHSQTSIESADPELTPKPQRSLQSNTVRIPVHKLDPLLRQVEEMVSVKLSSSQRVKDLASIMSLMGSWKQKWSSLTSNDRSVARILAGTDKVEVELGQTHLSKLVDFLQWNESCLTTLEEKLRILKASTESDSRTHGQMVDDLLEDMMNVLMLPCSSLMEVFPKLVRDLARDAGKEVNLEIRGQDLEIDRRILEQMKDPLIHLVRNSIDHGIEMPEERERRGKPRQGTITVAFSQVSGNQVELVVMDDGGGIDVARVREAAAREGMLSEQDEPRPDGTDALSLVFRSEVSTSPSVTSISGRGLGLAIVREKVETLGGNVSVATAAQRGTSFRILLPVTLSTFRGILVHAAGWPFIIPTSNVERVARIRKDVIKTVANRETKEVNGRTVPVARLSVALELPRRQQGNGQGDFIPVVILRSGENLVSFIVDSILQEQEVLVKGLGKQLSRVRNVAGATVLGSGELVPILNVQDLVSSAARKSFSETGPTIQLEELEDRSKHILVVEDSITSRMLLKNILESSGYYVTTTVDGADAWAALKTRDFDLVVSDIEMPRMDGFTLTANIRADEKLSDLPVVLVTSLGSREDRERGIDVGANAYIVKGSFDQNNLLETVERLI
jgi:two-component system chemotaxis sensor kinase CheA